MGYQCNTTEATTTINYPIALTNYPIYGSVCGGSRSFYSANLSKASMSVISGSWLQDGRVGGGSYTCATYLFCMITCVV